MITYVDPKNHIGLVKKREGLVNEQTGELVAPIVAGIPRFVNQEHNYAESFGYQWKRWHSIRSDVRNHGYNLSNVVLERTHFSEFDLAGKTILECGMGGGDDTEVLLELPFSEVHSFDLSTAVERAAQFLKDPRLCISQASIYDIPYPDRSFDVVYCHRVLQHTPDPRLALRQICAKVKPGGILFAHSYKRSWRYMSEWRYKYRWFTKRLPWKTIVVYLDIFGPFLHRLNRLMYRHRVTRMIAYNFIPFFYLAPHAEGGMTTKDSVLELEKQITFDALTPWHDHPMRPTEFKSIIESEGFEILYMTENPISPMYCTAIRRNVPS